jgi:hypothetical protein
MERRFSIEAKNFRFTTKDGSSLLRLEERRKKFFGYIFVSPQGSAWLMETVEEACLAKANIAKAFREGDKALMVHGGDNKAGRFLEVAVFAEGGRKGGLWLPEGRNGRGWLRFVEELRLLLASLDGVPMEAQVHSAPNQKSSTPKLAETGVPGEHSMARSFAEIVKSKTRSIDEKETGGDDLRWETAGSERTMKRSDVKGSVEPLLGFVQIELGRVVAGLLEGLLNGPDDLPIRKRIKALLQSLKVGAGLQLERHSGRVYGARRGKLGRKVNGLGWLIKSKKKMKQGPLNPVSSQRPSQAGASSSPRPTAVEPEPASEPEREVDKSPTRSLGKSPPLSMLPTCEVLEGASLMKSVGFDAEVVTGVASPAKSEGNEAPSSAFGLSVEDTVELDSTTLVASASPASIQVPAVPVAGLVSLDCEDPGESVQGSVGASVESGLLRGVRRLSLEKYPDFPLPWEEDVAASPSGWDREVLPVDLLGSEEPSAKDACNPPPMSKSPASPALPGVKDAVSIPDGAAALGRNLSHSFDSNSGISKAELGFFRRTKEKVAKQLNKNKELLAETIFASPGKGVEGPSKEVHRMMGVASVCGMTWGGDDNKMMDFFSARERERKTKGLRELKNLECSMSPAKSQRRQGGVGSKKDYSFPPEVH